MIGKVNIWMETRVLDDALFVICNNPLVDASYIVVEKVDFRETNRLNCVEDSDELDGDGLLRRMSFVFACETFYCFVLLRETFLKLPMDVLFHHFPKSVHPAAGQQSKLTDESRDGARSIRSS